MNLDDNYCEKTAEAIREKGCYAIGLGETSGALALAEGFMNVQYLVLHKLKAPIVFKLKEGSKLITKAQLDDIPHKLKDAEIFILFQSEEEQPQNAAKISQHVLTHPPKNYTIRQSYVTDINSMMTA